MDTVKSPASNARGYRPHFNSTRWSVVLYCSGSESDPVEEQHALAELCEIYWPPVYAFLLRDGYNPSDAEDLTQGFFTHLLQNKGYASANPRRGKFRSFLLGALKNFVADSYAREQALKRGGGQRFVPLTEALIGAESLAFIDASAGLPLVRQDKLFDERWAATLVHRALRSLRAEVAAEGKGHIFNALCPLIGGGTARTPQQDEAAAQLGMPINTLRTHLHRLRARYRVALRAEVAHTVASPDEVEAELRHLFQVLVGS